MVCKENKIRVRKDRQVKKASANEKNPKLSSCTEKQHEIILCLEANKKEAAKPLYLLRYE